MKLIHHYLDDFILVGAPRSRECAKGLDFLLETCEELGVPVEDHKCMGPTSCLVFLGICIDTQKMTISLPDEKLEQLKSMFTLWKTIKAGTRRELESLLGHLQHAMLLKWCA